MMYLYQRRDGLELVTTNMLELDTKNKKYLVNDVLCGCFQLRFRIFL